MFTTEIEVEYTRLEKIRFECPSDASAEQFLAKIQMALGSKRNPGEGATVHSFRIIDVEVEDALAAVDKHLKRGVGL